MSEKTKHIFQLTALAAALVAAYAPALAEGAENSVSVGVGVWSDDRPQRGVFDGMREAGPYPLLDADFLNRTDATGTWLGLKVRDLGLDSRELKAEWLRQGDIGGSLEYSRIPRENQWTFNTSLQPVGGSSTVQRLGTVAPGAGGNLELGTVRDRYGLKFFKNLGSDLKFNLSFRNEEKDGTRLWSRGGQPEFAIEPINSTIRLLEATLTYSRDRLQLSGGYYGTMYENHNELVITTSATAATATTPQTLNLSLPLSNQSHELFLNGGYNFTPTTRGTFKASFSRATQDEFLPTARPGLVWCATCAPAAIAPMSLDGRLDTTLLEVGVTSRPLPKLSVVGNLRYRDFADKTPLRQIISTGGGVWNTPFSYSHTIGKAEATYSLQQGYSVLGGVEHSEQDRYVPQVGTLYVPFRASLDETTYRVQLRKSMSETVNGSLAYAYSERDGGVYTVPGDPAEPAENLINPLNIADRKRDKWRAMLDWSATDRLNFQFAIEDSQDRYGGLPYGLQKGTAQLYTVDASYQFSRDWQATAWVSRDLTKAKETTQNAPGLKFNDLSETGTSFGIGLRGTVVGNTKVGGDVEQFRSVNQYHQGLSGTALTATQVPPPDITNRLLRFRLFAQYPLQKNADLRFNVIHEKWKTDDWSWTYFPASGPAPWPMMATTDGTTTFASPKQESTFVGVRYIYKFQ